MESLVEMDSLQTLSSSSPAPSHFPSSRLSDLPTEAAAVSPGGKGEPRGGRRWEIGRARRKRSKRFEMPPGYRALPGF